MRLVPDWRRVLKRAWSMWAMYAAIIFSGLEGLVYIWPDAIPLPRGVAVIGTMIVCALAPFLRIKAQKDFDHAS